jgi:hypothetical protein
MFLLGKQMTNTLTLQQQKDLDTAMKHTLEQTDDYRTNELGLNPMCGRTYTRPTEESMQQAALWNRMWNEDRRHELPGEPQEKRQKPAEYDDTLDTWQT